MAKEISIYNSLRNRSSQYDCKTFLANLSELRALVVKDANTVIVKMSGLPSETHA